MESRQRGRVAGTQRKDLIHVGWEEEMKTKRPRFLLIAGVFLIANWHIFVSILQQSNKHRKGRIGVLVSK